VSKLGKYTGFGDADYDSHDQVSDYLVLDDGTRLAYDLIRPALDGAPEKGPLPVLFMYTPYLRTIRVFDDEGRDLLSPLLGFPVHMRMMLRLRHRYAQDGDRIGPLFRKRWLSQMVEHGYVVVVVERPGTGASFGTSRQSMEAVATETDEILDWIAAQDWCDGNIGMFGVSQEAWCQFAAASTANRHLKAIFPASSQLELYDSLMYRGGVANKAFNEFFADLVPRLGDLAVPVDHDRSGTLLAQARHERVGGVDATTMTGSLVDFPYRDSVVPDGRRLWELMSLYPMIDRINRAGVPTAMTTGWYDIFLGDMVLWFANLNVPKRLTIRPVAHSGVDAGGSDLDYGAEAHRWFDHWLKGIDNGIMDEPPVHYWRLGHTEKPQWRTADRWPPNQPTTHFFFNKGKTGTVASTNDGLLATEGSATLEAADLYTVDHTATSGTRSRWVAINAEHDYPNLARNDEKGLTYTTLPLEADVDVTGHPVAHLWLRTDAPDLDIFVYLEDVDHRGRSTYVTEGTLRASHRELGAAPFNNLGLPFHSHDRADQVPIPPGDPFELVFALLPTAYRFHQGHRIRVTVTCADSDNFDTPVLTPAPTVRVMRGTNYPSSIELPLGPG
jgi:putative CocE/NonD family hydrolase